MKKINMKKGIFTALLLASPLVTAGTQYPAADFQPKVVFQDSDYKHSSSSEATTSHNTKKSASFGEKAAADSNYPAATFKPTVVFQDDKYKHTADKVVQSDGNALAVWKEVADEAAAEAAEEAVMGEEDSSVDPMLVIIIVAIAGFLFSKKTKSTKTAAKPAGRAKANTEGLSGVARYLQEKSPKLSGVAKYIENNQSAPKSGVAKYVARKIVASKQAAAEKVTGVEKYMRNKG
ncbi:MAG: hypothetical protein GQ582_10320 [Methyloprofundus sp.]|nr:hypothetical protein [Methyloprofundus sp.]